MPNSQQPASTLSPGGWRFLIVTAVLLTTWLVVLPWMSQRPSSREYRRWLESRRIDPSAMYYTELESLGPVLERLNRQQRD